MKLNNCKKQRRETNVVEKKEEATGVEGASVRK